MNEEALCERADRESVLSAGHRAEQKHTRWDAQTQVPVQGWVARAGLGRRAVLGQHGFQLSGSPRPGFLCAADSLYVRTRMDPNQGKAASHVQS